MNPPNTDYVVGLGRMDITPSEPVWMGGYGSRNRPCEGVLHPIFAKAIAIGHEGAEEAIVIVTIDLVGLSERSVTRIQKEAEARFALKWQDLILVVSHTHSGPAMAWGPSLIGAKDPDQVSIVERYGEQLIEAVLEVIRQSLESREAVSIEFGQGLSGLGVNRRRAYPGFQSLPAPVDHDLPVLRIRERGGAVKAVLFGYACHATALGLYEICGDWPGFACSEVEKAIPGAMALYFPGCGADINPLPRGLPGQEVILARRHGETIAAAVQLVLQGGMSPLSGRILVKSSTVDLLFERLPSEAEVEQKLASADPAEHYWALDYLREYAAPTGVRSTFAYPIHVLRIGTEFLWIFLCAEVVVDYSLILKGKFGWENTWVSGYADATIGYIPSRRVWEEGGYEGGDRSSTYFGLPSRFSRDLQDRILALVDELAC